MSCFSVFDDKNLSLYRRDDSVGSIRIVLLFTVILDSRIHAVALYWAVYFVSGLFLDSPPEVTVIDVNEYATRIFIILLVFLL